jgi:hypothetical protein
MVVYPVWADSGWYEVMSGISAESNSETPGAMYVLRSQPANWAILSSAWSLAISPLESRSNDPRMARSATETTDHHRKCTGTTILGGQRAFR